MTGPQPGAHDLTLLDPFDLPEWLGVDEVTWSSGPGCQSTVVS